MILQNITFAHINHAAESLYYKKNEHVTINDETMILQKNAKVNLCTYFNCFSSGKWKKYTGLDSINVGIIFQGVLRLSVYHLQMGNEVLQKSLIYESILESDEMKQAVSEDFALKEGMVGIEIEALSDDTEIEGMHYGTSQMMKTRDIQLGIGICTFKREEYVARNMNVLKEQILENEKALSYGHVHICISDNAGTLQKSSVQSKDIRVVNNKNLGGVGGFTRTMLEHMNSEDNITHILLMDDDAVISAESVERNYTLLTLLKPEYQDYVIGGALLRLDFPTIQYENGANWNDGDNIEAINHDADLQDLSSVIRCEKEYQAEYTGWWYSCIPVSFISEKKLPLPLFIHRDDIEYGLRAQKHLIFLNGICVWHEAFENKMPGFLEYYDIRNLAIVNAIHNPAYGAKEFKKMLFKEVSSNIGKYRYQYVDLNLKGAVDFLKGFRWFYHLDTLKLHGELGKYNYQSVPAETLAAEYGLSQEELEVYGKEEIKKPGRFTVLWKMATLNGHFFPGKPGIQIARPFPNIYELYRRKEVIFIDSTGRGVCVKRSKAQLIGSYLKLWKVCRLIDKHYEQAVQDYHHNYKKLETKEFWEKYLEIN